MYVPYLLADFVSHSVQKVSTLRHRAGVFFLKLGSVKSALLLRAHV